MLPLFDRQLPLKLTDIVLNALADGTAVVTANARAARFLSLSYAERQRMAGRTVWPSPAIFDWDSWLNRLWQETAFSDPAAPLLLTQNQEHTLWVRVQQNDAQLVVRPDGLAALAQGAYELLSKYELHRERNIAWLETDSESFRQWARTFDQLCRDRNWRSRNDIEALLIQFTRTNPQTLPKQILLVGFDRFTPVQQSLLQHFRAAGMIAEVAATEPPEASLYTLVAASDAHDALLTCARWCRQKLEINPSLRIGVIAPDIRTIRGDAERIFRAELMPQSLDIESEASPMPFEFSLGMPLSTVPVVRAALLLLRWTSEPLLEEEVSWLLLSGFVHGAISEILDLARLDSKRRDSGALSPKISLEAFASRHVSSAFSNRAGKLLKAAEKSHALDGNATYTSWCQLAEQLLHLAQWPGFRSPDSVQFQAQQRWLRLLDEVSLLDFAGRTVTFFQFLQTLERLANEATFTPESHFAPIQILGALESSGQTFDAVWFLGADDTQWPQVGRPHPFLPVVLQRLAKMPSCDSATATELAVDVTRRIAASAPECIFSYARQNKEGELRPSPILAEIFHHSLHQTSAADYRKQAAIPEPSTLPSLAASAVIPSQVVPWEVERIAGGADVLKDQAACPFRAFARRRLAAGPLNRTEWGLDAAQRGILLHTVLQTIWSPDSPEPFRMGSLDDLRNVISANRLDEAMRYHIGNAFQEFVDHHAEDTWMQAYLKSEQHRLLVRLREWLRYEANRQPFTVDKREEKLKDVNVGELKLDLRADRIDKLPDGSHLLIDYKTGEVSASAWNGERPDEPQLPLYAVFGRVERVSGLLFAQIRAGKTVFIGRAANPQQNLLADLVGTSSLLNQPYDKTMHDAWEQALLQLAEEFLRGEASVDPKHGVDTCRYCPLPGLCRIAEAGPRNELGDVEADYA